MITESDNKLVLVVDDSTTNNLLLQHLLQDEGYKVLLSGNGYNAIDIAKSKYPDLILLDIMMPGFDGFEILEELKKTETTKGIPVIMVTAKRDVWSMKKSMDLGAVDYVIKPIEIDNFLNKISNILK